MQLVTAFVNVSPAGHKGADFKSVFLYALGNLAAGDGHLRGFYVRNDLLGDEQDFLHLYVCRYFVSLWTAGGEGYRCVGHRIAVTSR